MSRQLLSVFNFRVRLEVMSIQLKDGGVYTRADGTQVTVRRRENYDFYPWVDQFGTYYTNEGCWFNHNTKHGFDLIRVVSEPDESVPTRDFLTEIAALEVSRDNWKKACLAQVELRHSALKEAAGWRKICEGHALRLEALGEKP
jgi:hypothetical protein